MYKVEISYDDTRLNSDTLSNIYDAIDDIFLEEDLLCIEKEKNKRVYHDQGRKQDYGRFWAAIFAMKNSKQLTDNLKVCFWYNGNTKEDLIEDFIRS